MAAGAATRMSVGKPFLVVRMDVPMGQYVKRSPKIKLLLTLAGPPSERIR